MKRVVWIGLVLAACAGAEEGNGAEDDAGLARDARDAGRRDGGTRDAGGADAGRRDAGGWDAGPRDAGARDAGPAPAIGTATAVDVCAPNPNLPSASCEVVQIQTDGNPTIFVRLHIARSVRRERGVVIFGSGTGGGGPYFDGSVGTNRLRDALLADGFVIVEWDDRVAAGLTFCSGRRSCQVNAEALVNATFVGEPCGPTGPPSPADLARLEADSPHRGHRPTCAVRVLVGEGDCGGVVPQGTRWGSRCSTRPGRPPPR